MSSHLALVVASVSLLALVLSLAWTFATWALPAAVCLVLCSVGWVLTNRVVEGPTLLVLARGHGLTVADLLSVVGLGVALATVVRRRRQTLARRRHDQHAATRR